MGGGGGGGGETRSTIQDSNRAKVIILYKARDEPGNLHERHALVVSDWSGIFNVSPDMQLVSREHHRRFCRRNDLFDLFIEGLFIAQRTAQGHLKDFH